MAAEGPGESEKSAWTKCQGTLEVHGEGWDAMKKYWESSKYKQKSEKMSETRSKVVYNPRVGRHGYAGKEAKLVSFLDV